MTARIVKAAYPGHVLQRPTDWSFPYIFASPHSGRHYPQGFLAATALDLRELRRSEDAYVDELLPAPDTIGVPVLSADFPRAFVDVNRSTDEIDVTMFTEKLDIGSGNRSNRVLAGFGVIPRLAAAGQQIYAQKLPASEARQRLQRCYAPYHDTLAGLIEEAMARFGHVVVLDWHSMPSTSAGNGRSLPDVVLGDRFGAACNGRIVDRWEKAMRETGLSTGRNTPYAGGHVTALYGEPGRQVHALQIEVNRALYLDESRTVRNRPHFRRMRNRLEQVIARATGIEDSGACLAAE